MRDDVFKRWNPRGSEVWPGDPGFDAEDLAETLSQRRFTPTLEQAESIGLWKKRKGTGR